MKSWVKALLTGFIFLIALVFSGASYTYYIYRSGPSVKFGSKGRNAMWARHDWVGKSHEYAVYNQLIETAERFKITDIYFHVGPLNAQGEIELEKYPFAAQLVSRIKSRTSRINMHAWIGQIEKAGGGPLNLSDMGIRREIVNTARIFLDLGFDGVHFNIEPIYTGNRDFIDLLKRARRITSKTDKILSVSCEKPEPFAGANVLARAFMKTGGFWKLDYYREIAEIVDQAAVMMYDTAIPYDWIYSSLVSRQTSRLLTVLDSNVLLFMGIPSYENKSKGFHPEAENVESAIYGIQMGLQSIEPSRLDMFGIAVYAGWTTDPDEWRTFEREWLSGSQ